MSISSIEEIALAILKYCSNNMIFIRETMYTRGFRIMCDIWDILDPWLLACLRYSTFVL